MLEEETPDVEEEKAVMTEGAVLFTRYRCAPRMLPPVVSRGTGGELGLLGRGREDRRAVVAREAS